MRFAENGPPGQAEAIAALALVRALAHYLATTKILTPDEIELVRYVALEDLTTAGDDPAIVEARALIEHEFP